MILDFCCWWRYYNTSAEFIIPNAYLPDWFEMDALCLNKTGLVDEFEFKISRGDFFADAKKKLEGRGLKHDLLRGDYHNHPLRRYYYVTPAELISLDEVPEFAGLICATQPKRLYNGLLNKGGLYYFRVLKHAPDLRPNKRKEADPRVAVEVYKKMAYRYQKLYYAGKALHSPIDRTPPDIE